MKTITMDYDTYINELQAERIKQYNEIKKEIMNLFPGFKDDTEVNGADLVDYITEFLMDC